MHKRTQALQSVNGPANTFDRSPKWVRTLPSLIYFSRDIYRDPPLLHKTIFNYQCWYLTPYCGFEVQNPPMHFNQLKVRKYRWIKPQVGKIFPSLIYFSYDILETPLQKKIKYQSWFLTPCCGLEVHKPTQALQSDKGLDNTFDWNPSWQELCRP